MIKNDIVAQKLYDTELISCKRFLTKSFLIYLSVFKEHLLADVKQEFDGQNVPTY